MQLRRLDPLAKASPYQRLLKCPVKSVSISEDQYERVRERRPELIVQQGEASVVGFPYRDYLELHYGFPDIESFRGGFVDLVERCAAASGKAEAPRGICLPFRDRPNRTLAEYYFWSLALDEGGQWVEMSWVAVPEQPEPGVTIADSFIVREATDKDRDVIAEIEAEVTGLPRLSEAGVGSIYENARWLRLVTDRQGAPVALLSLRQEPAGWGVIEHALIRPAVIDQLREPLLRWTCAWLRNNGGRRIRKRVSFDDSAEIALLRSLGFAAGETGVDYTRPVEASEVKQQMEERKGTGTIIKFGDWR